MTCGLCKTTSGPHEDHECSSFEGIHLQSLVLYFPLTLLLWCTFLSACFYAPCCHGTSLGVEFTNLWLVKQKQVTLELDTVQSFTQWQNETFTKSVCIGVFLFKFFKFL